MDFTIELGDMVAMIVSIICGGIIGFEREYRSKSAGLRTIMLISLGSTIFTIVSKHGVGTDDRISANIITGIGFIGAGVIFKDRISVRGLTTAAVIWTSAAIGMTAGIGYHALAFALTMITLVVLLMVTKVEKMIGRMQKEKSLSITFREGQYSQVLSLESMLSSEDVKLERTDIIKRDDKLIVVYKVYGKKIHLTDLSEKLAAMPQVLSFE